MNMHGKFAMLFLPWAGLIISLAGLILAHQFGSEGMFDDCSAIAPLPLLLVALLGLILNVIGAVGSWRVWRNRDEAPARRLIATISLGSAALFAIAIILPIIATAVLPPCFR
jgi:hypothetical protein